jgi:CRP-like cAMP-binding protein
MTGHAHLLPHELAILKAGLNQIAPLDGADVERMVALTEVRVLDRGQHLLRAGDKAVKTGVVLEGLVREYFVLRGGVERTKAFVQAGQPTGSLADLMSEHASRAFIVAEEPSRVLLTDFANMRALLERSPGWTQWSLQLITRMFIGKAEREYELLGLDAEQRYAVFKQRYPGLEARIAARHVASYCGITPVHLSRLRKRAKR